MNPKFTIITVCKNSELVIKKTIKSVLMQRYSNIEYLIVDGASEDDTIAIVEKYEKAFKKKGWKFQIYTEVDHGIYDAMNKGIRYATGEVIGFINAGDWYEKDAIATVAKVYEKTGFDYFYADVNLVRINGNIIKKCAQIDRYPTSRHWNHPSSFAKKSLYDELGVFQCKGVHDDFEFYLRVRKADKKIEILNCVLANFSSGGISNIKSLRMCKKRIMDRFQGYLDNGYSPLYILECVGIEVIKWMFH